MPFCTLLHAQALHLWRFLPSKPGFPHNRIEINNLQDYNFHLNHPVQYYKYPHPVFHMYQFQPPDNRLQDFLVSHNLSAQM